MWIIHIIKVNIDHNFLTKPEFKIKFNENYEDDNINIQILETQIENHNAKILNIHLRSEGNKRDGLIRFKSIIE